VQDNSQCCCNTQCRTRQERGLKEEESQYFEHEIIEFNKQTKKEKEERGQEKKRKKKRKEWGYCQPSQRFRRQNCVVDRQEE
jgi:hypothetical protein